MFLLSPLMDVYEAEVLMGNEDETAEEPGGAGSGVLGVFGEFEELKHAYSDQSLPKTLWPAQEGMAGVGY